VANPTPAEHTAGVEATFAGDDARLNEILRSAVRHLHAFIEEVGLTREEWMAGIQFLTAVGQRSDDVRQEFLLLSDTLGASMLVEMVNQDTPEGATEPTVLGPFYVHGTPGMASSDSVALADSGPPLVLTGTVRALGGAPIPGATVDVWQTSSSGGDQVQDPQQPEMHLRGVCTTDEAGRFEIRTVRPKPYSIPDDGPVGELLHAAGRHAMRPAHVHLIVSAPGFRTITTHAFDATSDHLDSDAVFGVRESLIVDMASGRATFDVVLAPDEPAP
jgi:catechol 1,2-dioxygenase